MQTLYASCLGAQELVLLLALNLQREAPSLLIPLHVDILLLLTEQNERDMSWPLLRIFKGQQSSLTFKAFCGLHTICILTTQLVQKYHFHSKASLFYWLVYVQDHFLYQEERHFYRSTSVTGGLVTASAASADEHGLEIASVLWPAHSQQMCAFQLTQA